MVRVRSFLAMMLSMSPDLGAHRRALLEGPAGEVFRETVRAGGLGYEDKRLQRDHDDHEATALLIDLGLLRDDPAAGCWVAVDPATVQSTGFAAAGRERKDKETPSTGCVRYIRCTHQPVYASE